MTITLRDADALVAAWRRSGAIFDDVGGVWKRKPTLHDIDILAHDRNLALVEQIVRANKSKVPVEIYHTDITHYQGLLFALRSGTWDMIHGKLMKGLRFGKVRIE